MQSVSNMPEADLIKKINRYFHDEEARFFKARHSLRMESESRFYKYLFKDYFKSEDKPVRILDIGSGTGLVATALPAGDNEIICTDISYEMLALTKNNLRSRNNGYVACDAERLPFRPDAFDMVTCNAAMHHLPSIEGFARELDRVLVPGGIAIIGFESNRKFWTTRPVSILYRAMVKLSKRAKRNDSDYGFICDRVNERLVAEKTIELPMTNTDIFTLVDVHSPNAGVRIDYSKALDAGELERRIFKGYKATVFYHYDEGNKLFASFNRLFFPKAAPQFSVILEKWLEAKRIKILFVFVHLNYGGAEVGLLTVLKNIDRDRFDCTIVSIEKRGVIGEEIEKLGFKVIYLDSPARLFNFGLADKIRRILKAENPDILHTSLFYANFFGRFAALFNKPPIVVTEERSMYTEKRFYHIIIDKILSGVTDKIVVCSNSVLDFTARQEKINRAKFRLIYNAVDAERFNVSKPKDIIRDEYGFSKKEFIIGTVGSLIPKKGQRFLIAAFSALTKDIPHIKLLIIGDGKERSELEVMVGSKGIGDKVVFLGARGDVPELMKTMDVFVLPSLQEGFPRTLIEAMYTGLAVVASNISGIPEVISDGENGFLVPPGSPDAIRKRILDIYKDFSLRRTLGSNARRKIETGYLPKDYMKSLQSLYLELAEKKQA